ncbi:tryptophan synthase subunit alpha [Clostridium sediminicola]|uniref:tryptophan synthase subunit alpha n=1 Tax=Clostridium sediminicola TaxID=3114879 RepID=UPI0031F25C85
MNRIEKKFLELKKENKKALITYITAGTPTMENTEKLIYTHEQAGASIVEIGIPFSDALADGPTIQKAALDSLQNGTTIKSIFECVEKVRENTDMPLVFMAYYNSILTYGVNKFINKCINVGIDGLIIPDLPLEEQEEVEGLLERDKLILIQLVAPTSKDRLKKITENKKGFIYCVSSLGVTGMNDSFYKEIDEYLNTVKEVTDLPIAVGFGIKTKEDVQRMKPFVDGVIVGSAIVKLVHESNCNYDIVMDYIRELNNGLE